MADLRSFSEQLVILRRETLLYANRPTVIANAAKAKRTNPLRAKKILKKASAANRIENGPLIPVHQSLHM